MTNLNCVDILKEASSIPDVQFIGGFGAAALTLESTMINIREKRIVARADMHLSQLRPNGTKRDVDVFVPTSDVQKIQESHSQLVSIVGNDLELSVFGLKKWSHVANQIAKPFGLSSMGAVVSDRYEDDSGKVHRAIFPFALPISHELLEPWSLEIGDRQFTTASPATTILNYYTRSITGLRAKDTEKIGVVVDNVLTKEPMLKDWMFDGPGKSQIEIARVLNSLRFGDRALILAGNRFEPIEKDNLVDHEAFLLADKAASAQRATVKIAAIKSRTIGAIEQSPHAVGFFQQHIESKASAIVHNDV